MKLFCAFLFIATVFISCTKSSDPCNTNMKLTATATNPVVGDDVNIDNNNGDGLYQWYGPGNFSTTTTTSKILLDQIKINASGWYYCSGAKPGCNGLHDSIYIAVQYKQGTPACSLTNNTVTSTNMPTTQAISVSKQFDGTWNCMSVRTNVSFGYPIYTVLFNSYNGQTEPKDGIYRTVSVQAFDPFQDANVIYLQCQYSSYFFKSWPDQDVYVSHVNGKLRVSFCSLKLSGDNGNSVMVTTNISGQLTEN